MEKNSNRLLSLDFFRGFTMLLLIAEWTILFDAMINPDLKGSFIFFIGEQLHHQLQGIELFHTPYNTSLLVLKTQ